MAKFSEPLDTILHETEAAADWLHYLNSKHEFITASLPEALELNVRASQLEHAGYDADYWDDEEMVKSAYYPLAFNLASEAHFYTKAGWPQKQLHAVRHTFSVPSFVLRREERSASYFGYGMLGNVAVQVTVGMSSSGVRALELFCACRDAFRLRAPRRPQKATCYLPVPGRRK